MGCVGGSGVWGCVVVKRCMVVVVGCVLVGWLFVVGG